MHVDHAPTEHRRADDQVAKRFGDGVRVIVVAGVSTGAVVIGVGSRLAMMLLRVTSGDRVHGVVSDDGFVIGRVTLAGSYNLLLVGAGFGMIGAAAYRAVSPRLLGPRWFRRLTVALASGAVVGSALVHDDGVDFHLLHPTWLAITLFVALPALFGLAIAVTADSIASPGSWTARGRRTWVLPAICLACFPPAVFVAAVLAIPYGAWVAVTSSAAVERVRCSPAFGLVVRAAWLSIALLGLAALVSDTRDIVTSGSASPAAQVAT